MFQSSSRVQISGSYTIDILGLFVHGRDVLFAYVRRWRAPSGGFAVGGRADGLGLQARSHVEHGVTDSYRIR